MRVTANGKVKDVAVGTTVLQLVEQSGLSAERTIVEHNGTPLRRQFFSTTILQPGDKLEIAQMVGGG